MRLAKDNVLWLPDGDTWSFWGTKYEIGILRKLKDTLGGHVALDVGAHVGIWTLRLAEHYDKVICFEPLPKHIECHEANTEKLTNVTLNKFALSNERGPNIIRTMKSNSGRSSIDKEFSSHMKCEEIEIHTDLLDNHEFEVIDFMKIDVEGHELKMLEGAYNTISRHKPDIFIEVWPENVDTMFKYFEDIGYDMTKQLNSQNYLFIHKDKNKVLKKLEKFYETSTPA